MALVECPECGKEISDQAKMCPDCGYDINYETRNLLSKTNIRLMKYLLVPTLLALFLLRAVTESNKRISEYGLLDNLIVYELYIIIFFTYVSIGYYIITNIVVLKITDSNKSKIKKIYFTTLILYVILILLFVAKSFA